MVRLIVFNIDTSSCKIGWSLPYHFKIQLNLLGYCILCESESLYLIRSMYDQNLLIPHTFYHITTKSRKFLYFMLIFIKTSWSCYERINAPITTYAASYLVAIAYPIIFGDLFMTLQALWHLVAKTRLVTNILWRWCMTVCSYYIYKINVSSVFSTST